MMDKGRAAVIVIVLSGVSVFGVAVPAGAASDSGDWTCTGVRTARLTSDTAGATKHRWVNNSTGDSKVFNFTGGVNGSFGYTGSNHWVLTASVISSRSLSCID